jgi:hypothetical protein
MHRSSVSHLAKWRRRRDDVAVAEESLLYGERTWFYDVRSPVRRMAVSSHPAAGCFVVSFWQGDVCTGTFRLPQHDGGRLVAELAHGMAEAIPRVAVTAESAAAPAPTRWQRALDRLTHRHASARAPHLRSVP